MESILNELVDVLRSNKAPEQLRSNNDTVEQEVFWSEKRKHIDARNPTGFFNQPVFQKYCGFGRVETQFVSDPFYLEVPNAPTGYLRDAYGRSLNPDTFHHVFSDTDLRRMNAGRVDDRSPQSVQETQYTVRTGSSGFKEQTDLHQRIAELREGEEKRRFEHLGPNGKFVEVKSKHGIFNPGESMLEPTGLGTSGVDIYSVGLRVSG
ncbi:hypothetical protein PhCBS80983_g06364 [Powellomyces hirtus]|uniref:Uncharacterized protein n=1 Tax=Powellomyces hirtus TaxID=109895 RepID=A0A507DPB3_9FUNG|nr:hypothetical protein PhCBS80983_g06364 [Powellomyces hirtus]